MRAAIARRMSASKREAPHFYVSSELDMEAVIQASGDRNGDRPREARVTVTAYLLRATALALGQHPALNAVWAGDRLELSDAVHLGTAIALDQGLIAPAILDAQALDLEALAVALRDIATRARAGRLRAPELSDGTFTVSNLGMYDVSSFTAIINPPQVAILATSRAEPRPTVIDGTIAVRQRMTATVSADHRAVDGATVAAFLTDLGRLLREPGGWGAA